MLRSLTLPSSLARTVTRSRKSPSRTSPKTLYRSRARIRNHLTMDDQRNREHGHDTHAIPPQAVCDLYKKYQRMNDASIDGDLDVVDFKRGLTDTQKKKLVPIDTVPSETIDAAKKAFLSHGQDGVDEVPDSEPTPCTIYEHKDFPGLRLFPSLLPPECQSLILDSILHRDLSNPLHQTNLTPSYAIPFPPPTASFFSYAPHSKHQTYAPRDPSSSLKPLNTTQFLAKKLRWLTLGAQYDWTTRAYPAASPTPFPPDIAALVTALFRGPAAFTPESGVVLLYSPKDFMPVHRDVSEECARGLASFSLGCDGLFVVSRDVDGEGPGREHDLEREMQMCVLRVRSGDCVWMGGEARWCWHAMPKVLAGTCPSWLEDWPAAGGGAEARRTEYEKWRGFMKGKRLNLSCRQVWG